MKRHTVRNTMRVYFKSSEDLDVSAYSRDDAAELARMRVESDGRKTVYRCEVSEVFNQEEEQ